MRHLFVFIILILSLIKIVHASPYVSIEKNFGFIMSSSIYDNGGSTSDFGIAVGYKVAFGSAELFYKGLTFDNEETVEDTGQTFKTEMEDSAFGLNLKVAYTDYIDFFIGLTSHTVTGKYEIIAGSDIGPLISLIDGSYLGFSWGFGFTMPVWRTWNIFLNLASYKVNSPISFFNAEIGIRYMFGAGSGGRR